MKALLIICCSLLATSGYAQIKKATPPGTMPNVPLFKTDPQNYLRRNLPLDSIRNLLTPRMVPSGVYNLPQDNMPCIVPNTLGMTPIPNAFSSKQLPFRSAIPNAAPFKSPMPWVVPQSK